MNDDVSLAIELTEPQQLLRSTVRSVLADHVAEHGYPALGTPLPADSDRSLWALMAELDWNRAPFSEATGGFGGGLTEAGLIVHELGRAGRPAPYLHSTIAAGLALADAGHAFAEEIANSAATVVPLQSVTSTGFDVRTGGDGAVVSGRATGVAFAADATHYLVPGQKGVAALVRRTPAMAVRQESIGLQPLYEVTLQDAPAELIEHAELVPSVESFGASATALSLLGACQSALARASSFALERHQFGKPIGSFQAIQHKLADMLIAIQVAVNLAYEPARLHAEQLPISVAASHAKAWLSDTALFVTRQAMQVHGGVGFVADHPIQVPFRLTPDLVAQYGTGDYHRSRIASLLMGDAS